MGLYYIKLDELSEFTGLTVEQLKEKSYSELEQMQKSMEQEKFLEQNNQNSQDKEYERIVLKYFSPVKLLENWFTHKEIVYACASTGVTVGDICVEIFMEPGVKCAYPDAEFLRTSVESVPQYDSRGRELLERKSMTVDVYHIANKYQTTRHGQVVLKLLYDRYPELKEFGFNAYGMDGTEYEIYPGNGIYTAFIPLMMGNIDAILYRNRRYCEWYNSGRYSLPECEKAFRKKEAAKMFAMIRSVGKKEIGLGHTPVKEQDGKLFIGEKILAREKGGLMLFWDGKPHQLSAQGERCFIVRLSEGTMDAAVFIERYDELMAGIVKATNIHLCRETDYLRDNAVNVTFSHNMSDEDRKDLVADLHRSVPENDQSKFIKRLAAHVTGTFGYINGNIADLVIRV